RPHSTSTSFPYTTLFRSHAVLGKGGDVLLGGGLAVHIAAQLAVAVGAHHNVMPLAVDGGLQQLLAAGRQLAAGVVGGGVQVDAVDRKSTRLNSSHVSISY